VVAWCRVRQAAASSSRSAAFASGKKKSKRKKKKIGRRSGSAGPKKLDCAQNEKEDGWAVRGEKKQVACAGNTNRPRFYFKFLLLYSLIIFLRRIISLGKIYSLIKLIRITKFRMLHDCSNLVGP
jgi:hypothetical protein